MRRQMAVNGSARGAKEDVGYRSFFGQPLNRVIFKACLRFSIAFAHCALTTNAKSSRAFGDFRV